MPNEVRRFFASSQFYGWTIGAASACAIESDSGSLCFAAAQKDSHNVLYGFENKSGQQAGEMITVILNDIMK